MRHLISSVSARNSHDRLRKILDTLLHLLLQNRLIVGDCLDLRSRILTGIWRSRFDNMRCGGRGGGGHGIGNNNGVWSVWWMDVDGCGWAVLGGGAR